MMDTSSAQTAEGMQEGLGLDALLAVGAVLAAVGWALTQFLASSPGVALSTVGVDGAVLTVAYWAVATAGMAATGVLAGARVVRYSPLLWLWGVLVSGALALNALVLAGALGGGLATTLLWTPWPVVLGVGFAVTGAVAAHRNRAAYAVGTVAAALVLLGAVLFPTTVVDWAFAATGVVHAAPLLVDARSDAGAADDADGGYEFRDVADVTEDER